ncbi:MAG TPA: hypothetical protein VGO11_10450 [Chthoniobacteraceae bacterium]|jgi:hypothetical protein|nr:hypothetical protein [Chthoniobacteraceae bacterium]
MSAPDEPRPAKLLESFLLALVALLAHAPLYYQLPRWGNGLDPTFVHPTWFELSPFPCLLYMAAVHPAVWLALIAILFLRVCRNFGWKLAPSCR